MSISLSGLKDILPGKEFAMPEDALRYLATPGIFSLYAHSLLQDQSKFKEIAARSYVQGNGFIKIVLQNEQPRIRLHIWLDKPEQLGRTAGLPHNHRRDFITTLLNGGYQSTIWEEAPDGNPYNRCLV